MSDTDPDRSDITL